jgi:hypothetical protein
VATQLRKRVWCSKCTGGTDTIIAGGRIAMTTGGGIAAGTIIITGGGITGIITTGDEGRSEAIDTVA